MGDVASESLQHADPADLHAMAVYLKSLPASEPPHASRRMRVLVREAALMQKRGADIYGEHCAQCHGDNGEGRAPAAPALAGNRAVTMTSPVNPIRLMLFGGYTPGTVGNRSEEHTSELQSLMRISYAVFCLKKKNKKKYRIT